VGVRYLAAHDMDPSAEPPGGVDRPPRWRRRADQDAAVHRRPRRRAGPRPPGRRRSRRLPHPHYQRQGRQGPHGALPRLVQGTPRPAHRQPAQGRRRLLVRVVVEEARQRPRRPHAVGPLHPGRRHHRLDQPHTLRHFLFTWLKTQGIDDALIQSYSGSLSPTPRPPTTRSSTASPSEAEKARPPYPAIAAPGTVLTSTREGRDGATGRARSAGACGACRPAPPAAPGRA
jgi:hypothetical protein